MPENTNAPVPPPPPQNAGGAQPAHDPQDKELQAQYERIKSKHRFLKIATIVLSLLLALVAGVSFYIYRRVMQVKDEMQEAFEGFPQQPLPAMENARLPAAGPSGPASGPAPTSSLGLFSGGLPQQTASLPNFTPEDTERIARALNRYSDRPIVKEMLADFKKNPDVAKAMAEGKANNPLAAVLGMRNARGMDKVVAKYATRPEFFKLVIEVMNDPDIRPLMSKMQGVPGIPAMPAMPNMPAMPGQPPAAASSSVQQEPERSDQDGDGELTFDSSAISGGQAPAGSAPADKQPSRVDTQ